MDLLSEIQSRLKKEKKSVSTVVTEMGISRNTFYYQLNKDIPDQEFIDSLERVAGINIKSILTKSTDVLTKTIQQVDIAPNVPMYNAPAAASGVEVYTDPTASGQVIGYMSFPGITKGSFALQVYGNSMSPTLENGSWVVLRPIDNKHSIVWGQVYYIEFENYRLYKRLLKSDTDDEVILWSDNQDEKIAGRPIHAPINLPKESIKKLCLVTDIYIKPNH